MGRLFINEAFYHTTVLEDTDNVYSLVLEREGVPSRFIAHLGSDCTPRPAVRARYRPPMFMEISTTIHGL